jgi:hypothetical protein
MTNLSTLYPAVFEPSGLAQLARGLSMTLRSLTSNRGCDEWTGVSVSKKLAIQRFYKEFDAWIREMETLSASSSGTPPTGCQITSDNCNDADCE